MGRGSTPLLVLGLCGICAGLIPGNCTNYKPLLLRRVSSVPGDVALLQSPLLSSDAVSGAAAVPYDITWYDLKTGEAVTNQNARVLIHQDSLWFLNVTLEDAGSYESILRTPTGCLRHSTSLVVDRPVAAECGRPKKVEQNLSKGVTDSLPCPLKDFIQRLERLNVPSSIRWYKGCDLIVDGTDGFTYRDKAKLKIDRVDGGNQGSYTCTLNFTLGGVTGSVSETIQASVSENYSLAPQVHEPPNETVKAALGSTLTRRCRVFVPCVGRHHATVFWEVRGRFIVKSNPSDHVHSSELRTSRQEAPHKGMWLVKELTLSGLREEDFNVNYTCRANSARGPEEGYFTLLQADPDVALPVGLVAVGVTTLFVVAVIVYYLFKVDLVLWFRRVYPILYVNKDLDGKLYDAYVAYPTASGDERNAALETFAMETLPQVLEKACGYKLFITDRDGLPGQFFGSSVEENMQASRRLLLLYSASTFSSRRHNNNNNNISKDGNQNHQDHQNHQTGDVYLDPKQQFEFVAAMHRVLLEASHKVILVELEEVSPAQLALFPESVRHLRKKQGAVCWWKEAEPRRRWRTCLRRDAPSPSSLSPSSLSPSSLSPSSLSPSSRFWKEIRYSMPVRGKRAAYPERTALLNL